MNKTKIITIEGIDGSGKTVQFELLADRLRAMGFTVQKRAYPVYNSFFGGQIGKYLSCAEGVSAENVDQKSMALWFAMDRYADFRNYCDGDADFLIINRYVLSNAVYQSIRDCDPENPDFADWVFHVEYDVLGLPRPNLNLFFDVDTECAGKNVDKKGFRDYIGAGRDVYEKSSGIQSRARAKYHEMAARYSDTVIIPCTENGAMLPPEAISDAVISLLRVRGLV